MVLFTSAHMRNIGTRGDLFDFLGNTLGCITSICSNGISGQVTDQGTHRTLIPFSDHSWVVGFAPVAVVDARKNSRLKSDFGTLQLGDLPSKIGAVHVERFTLSF